MKKKLLLIGILLLAFLAHTTTQYKLFSLFNAAVSIPLMIVLIHPFPTALAIFTLIVLELFSSLPHGSMVLLFLVPYGVLFFWKSLKVDLSWKFFSAVVLITTLQLASLFCIAVIVNPTYALQIPWHSILAQIFVTSLGTFVLAFTYHEYS